MLVGELPDDLAELGGEREVGREARALLDADLERHLLRREQHRRALLRALHHGLEGREQAEEVDLQLRLVVVAGDDRHALVRALPLRGAPLLALVQQFGGRLELLVLEQSSFASRLSPRNPRRGMMGACSSCAL